MESFNRGEHVVAAFLDIEKAFDNVWHNGLRYYIFMPNFPVKVTRWLSDFLVGCVIQVNVNGFMSNQINPKAGVPQGSVQHRTTNKTRYPSSLMIRTMGFKFRRTFCSKPFTAGPSKLGNVVCQMKNQIESRRNQGDHIVQVHTWQKNRTHCKTVWRDTKSLSSSNIFRNCL